MSGRNPWWNSWTRAWYLIGMHAAVDLHAAVTVTCQSCGQTYDSYETYGSPARNQGCNISGWHVDLGDGRWAIHCGYGSDYDLREFWYIRDFPDKPLAAICDFCIARMLADGVVLDSGREFTFDGFTQPLDGE